MRTSLIPNETWTPLEAELGREHGLTAHLLLREYLDAKRKRSGGGALGIQRERNLALMFFERALAKAVPKRVSPFIILAGIQT